MGTAVRRNFSIGVGGQVLTVREQRSKRDAMAAPSSGGGIGTPYNGNSVAVRRSARVGIGTRYNARDAGMSRAAVRWDPKISSTAPVRVPRPSLHQISRGAVRATN